MVGLATLVLAFGLPTATRTLRPEPANALEGSGRPPAEPAAASPAAPPLVAPFDPISEAPTPSAPGLQPVDPGPEPAATLRVVALVDPAQGVGERTDEAMAKRFLATAGVPATVVAISDPTSTCAAAKGATLAIAGGSLPAGVRTCLRAAGVTILAFEDASPVGPVDGAVSSRRGAARSLLDTARRAHSVLEGELGLVADERLRPVLEPVLPTARSLGLRIAQVTWLPTGPPPAGLALDLAADDLGAVLFATSTQNQAILGSQLRTLSPGTRFVVLDAADSITSAGYPPVFDGATAVTSVQLPWHPGAKAQRNDCRTRWERAQTPPLLLDSDELLRALTWCQHAAMAAAAGERLEGDVTTAVTGQTVASPITSALALLSDGGFGPTRLTITTWSASCACWSAASPFTGADDG
jgi:hypothetical protein